MASLVTILIGYLVWPMLHGAMALTGYDPETISLAIRSDARLASPQKTKYAESILQVFIRSKGQQKQLKYTGGDSAEVSDNKYESDNIFEILQPTDGYFQITKPDGTNTHYLEDSDGVPMVTSAPSAGQWRLDDPNTNTGSVKFKSVNGKKLKAKGDGTLDRENESQACGSDRCKYKIFIYKIKWSADADTETDDYSDDYYDPWSYDYGDDYGYFRQKKKLLRSDNQAVRSRSSVGYMVWLTALMTKKQFKVTANGNYKINNDNFGDAATFILEDSGGGDDVFYIKDEYGKYMGCTDEGTEVVQVDSPSTYNAWRLVRIEDNVVAIQNVDRDNTWLKESNGGDAKVGSLSGGDATDAKNKYKFKIVLKGFAA